MENQQKIPTQTIREALAAMKSCIVSGEPWTEEMETKAHQPAMVAIATLEKDKRREGQVGFGGALEALKQGQRVQRAGWNGKGMWLALQKGYPEGVPANANSAEAFHIPEGTTIRILPYIVMKTVDGSFVPWLASQTDVLAEDWSTLE